MKSKGKQDRAAWNKKRKKSKGKHDRAAVCIL